MSQGEHRCRSMDAMEPLGNEAQTCLETAQTRNKSKNEGQEGS